MVLWCGSETHMRVTHGLYRVEQFFISPFFDNDSCCTCLERTSGELGPRIVRGSDHRNRFAHPALDALENPQSRRTRQRYVHDQKVRHLGRDLFEQLRGVSDFMDDTSGETVLQYLHEAPADKRMRFRKDDLDLVVFGRGHHGQCIPQPTYTNPGRQSIPENLILEGKTGRFPATIL
jgi:hypothetical protein